MRSAAAAPASRHAMIRRLYRSTALHLQTAASLTRVRDFSHFVFAPLIPLACESPAWTRVACGVAAGAFCLAFAYAFNEWKDEIEPAIRRGQTPISWSPRFVRVFVAALGVAALALAGWSSVRAFLAALVSLVVSFLYSGGPRLKRFPFVGTLTNAGIFVPVAFVGLADSDPLAPACLLLTASFAMLVLEVQVVHEYAHLGEDRDDGVLTTALRVPPATGRWIVFGFGLLAVASLAGIGFLYEPPWVFFAAPVPLLVATGSVVGRRALSPPDVAASSRLVLRYTGLFCGGVAWAVLAAARC